MFLRDEILGISKYGRCSDQGVCLRHGGRPGQSAGAVISGLLLGFLETIISAYVSTTYRDLVAYGLLVIVLIFKPNGLLGKSAHDKL